VEQPTHIATYGSQLAVTPGRKPTSKVAMRMVRLTGHKELWVSICGRGQVRTQESNTLLIDDLIVLFASDSKRFKREWVIVELL